MSDLLLKPDCGDLVDDCYTRQSITLPSGHNVEDDPLGNACADKVHCPTHVSHSIRGSKGKEFEHIGGYQTTYPVGYGEEEADTGGTLTKVAGKRKEVASSSMGGSKTYLDELITDPTLGQKVDNIYGHNGPHTPDFEYSLDPNVKYFGPETNLGLSTHTTPEVQINEFDNFKEQQQEPAGALQVYSRKRWCKKNEA
ncbi:hypothetical protein AAZX31_10G101000 [Glycine max]|nr:hypothetical protein JHK87_027530 [Glycine soja]